MEQLTLISRAGAFAVPLETGKTIVEIAKKQKVPWGYACERGNCAQCRTKVIEGAEFLHDVTAAEKLRLRKAERLEGYRLGCQLRMKAPGKIVLAHRPY
jgi:2Fe-2S ferredoxin